MIAILAHTHPSITAGGAEISAYTLYRGLRALGEPACFIAMCPVDAVDRVRLDTPDEHVVPYDPRDYDAYYHLAGPDVGEDVLALLDALGCRRVVFHHFLFFGLDTVRAVARSRPGRAWLVLHEFLAICHHHGQMVTRPALRLCAASSPGGCAGCFPERDAVQFVARRETFLDVFAGLAGFVSPSRFLKDRFVAWGLPADAIAVIENGVPVLPGPEPAAGAPARAGEPAPPLTIGFFGQINPFKGVDLILDAAALLAEDAALAARVRWRIHGQLVGQSEAFAERFRAACARHPFLQAMGPYANDRVFELMRGCDFVLMASQWWENSPVVIQEAYACGRPLIVPGLGGMAEKIVDGVTGLHFRPGDPADLVRALRDAADGDTRHRLRERLPAVSTGVDMARHYLAAMAGAPASGARPAALPSPPAPRSPRGASGALPAAPPGPPPVPVPVPDPSGVHP